MSGDFAAGAGKTPAEARPGLLVENGHLMAHRGGGRQACGW